MPQVNSTRGIAPVEYKGPTQPMYGVQWDSQPLGSADTYLGKMFGNYYDKYHIPEYSQANQRFYNQGRGTALVNSAAKLATDITLGGTAALVGALSLPLTIPTAMAGGGSFMDGIEQNPGLQLAEAIGKTTSSIMPTFQREDFNSLNFLDQIRRPGELATQNLDSIAFLGQAILSGGVMAEAKLGTAFAKTLSKYKPLYKAGTMLEGPNLAKVAEKIDYWTTLNTLVASEAALEAKDGADQLRQAAVAKMIAGEANYTEEELKKLTDTAGFNIFWQNMATGMVTNAAFMRLLGPIFSKSAVATRNNPFKYLASEGRETFAKPKTYSGLHKFMDKGYAPTQIAKGLVDQVFFEGIEESVQYSIQKVNELDNLSSSFAESTANLIKDLPNVLDLSDPERGKAFGLGALIGGISIGGVSLFSGFKAGPYADAKSYSKQREELLNNLNTSYTNYINSSIFKTTKPINGKLTVEDKDGAKVYVNEVNGERKEVTAAQFDSLVQTFSPAEDGTYKVDAKLEFNSKGEPIVDPVKAKKFEQTAKLHAELDDYMDQEVALDSADKTRLRIFQREKLNDLALKAFESGSTEILISKLRSFAEAPIEEQLKIGIQNPENTAAEVESMVKHVERLEALYLTTQNSTQIMHAFSGYDDKDIAINKDRVTEMYRMGARLITLDDLIDDNTVKAEQLKSEVLSKYKDENQRETVSEVMDMFARMAYLDEHIEALFAEENKFLSEVTSDNQTAKLKEVRAKRQKAARELSSIKDKVLTDFKEYKDLSTNSEFENYTRYSLNQRQLVDAREELGKKFDSIADTKTGYDNYKKIVKSKSTNLLTPYERYRSTSFSVHEDVIAEEYEAFEERKIRSLLFKHKSSAVAKEFYDELINAFVNTLKSQEVTLEQAASLRELVENILDKGIRLYPQSYEQLVSVIQTFVGRANEMYETKVAPLQQLVDNINDQFDSMMLEDDIAEDQGGEMHTDEEYDTLREKLVKAEQDLAEARQEYDELASALGRLLSNTTEVLARLNDLQGLSTPSLTRPEARKQAIETLFNDAKSLIMTTKFDGDTIDEEFTGLARVQIELNSAKIVLEKILKPLSKKDKFYIPYVKEMEAYIKSLEAIKELTLKNRANKELKARKENELYAQGIVDTLQAFEPGPIFDLITTRFGAGFADTLKKAYETDKVLGAKLLSEALLYLDSSQVLKFLADVKTQILTDLLSTAELSSVSKDFLKAFANSPVKNLSPFFSEILNLENNAALMNTVTETTALRDFVNTYDIVKFKENLKTHGGRFTAEDIEHYFNTYLQLASIQNLNMTVKTAFSEKTALKDQIKFVEDALEEIKNNGKGVPAPSSAQERVATEISRFILGGFNPENKLGQNVMTLKAPAGAGKSTIVMPLVKAQAKLADTEILIAAGHREAADNLAKAVEADEDAVLVNELVDRLMSNQIPSSIKTIFIDEVGSLTIPQANKLLYAISYYNRTNNRNVMVVMIYDPKQTTSGNAGFSVFDTAFNSMGSVPGYADGDAATRLKIEQGEGMLNPAGEVQGSYTYQMAFAHNITEATPLSVSYRSASIEINDLMDAFKSDSEVEGLYTSSTNLNGELYGAYAQSSNAGIIQTIHTSIAADRNRSRVVVVADESMKSKYSADLASTGVKVYTVEEVKGLTFDEAYVDIPRSAFTEVAPYNQAMYTAISRAAKFAYVANLSTTHTFSDSIADKTKQAAGIIENRHEAVLEVKKQELEIFENIFKDELPKASAPATTPAPPTPPTTPPTEPTQPTAEETEEVEEEPEVETEETTTTEEGTTTEEPTPEPEIVFNPGDKFESDEFIYEFVKQTKKAYKFNRTNKKTGAVDKVTFNSATLKQYLDNGQLRPYTEPAAPTPVDTKEVKKAKPEPTPVVVENEEDFANQLVPENTEEYETITDPSESLHILEYPTSQAFYSDETNGFEGIAEGSNVILVKDITPYSKDGKNKIRYSVVQKSTKQTADGKDLFRIVGVLSEPEALKFAAKANYNLDTLPPIRFSKIRDTAFLEGNNVKGLSLRIAKGTHNTVFKYGQNATVDFTSKSSLASLAAKYLRELYGEKFKDEIQNAEEILKNPFNFFKPAIFQSTKETSILAKKFKHMPVDARPKTNVPYLVIEGIKTKTGHTINPTFIRLVPTILDENTEAARNIGLEHIYTLIDKVKDFEKALDKSSLPGRYKDLKMGSTFTVANQVYLPFHMFIARLADTHRGKSADTAFQITSDSSSAEIKAMFPQIIDKSIIPADLLKLAYEIDVLMHGERGEGDRRGFKGPAQLAFDKIAGQNLMVTLPTGEELLLRDFYVSVEIEDGNKITREHVKGRPLLGNVKFERNNGLSHNPVLEGTTKTRLAAQLKRYQLRLESRLSEEQRAQSPRYQYLMELLKDPDKAHIMPITLSMLESLFVKGKDKSGKFVNVSNGFGLRTPLSIKSYTLSTVEENLKEGNVPSLAGYVQSHLEGIVPAQVGLELSPDAQVQSDLEIENKVRVNSLLNQLRTEISTRDWDISREDFIAGLRSKYEPDVISEFILEQGADTLEAAVSMYIRNSWKPARYSSTVKSLIVGLRQAVDTFSKFPDREDQVKFITEVIKDSASVVESSKYSNHGYAARDYIRAVFYALATGTRLGDADMIPHVLKVARKWLPVQFGGMIRTDNVNYVENFLYEAGDANGLDMREVYENTSYIMGLFAESLNNLGVELQFEEGANLLEVVEAIVKATSEYRQEQRAATSTTVIQDENLVKLVTYLVEQYPQVDETEWESILDTARKLDPRSFNAMLAALGVNSINALTVGTFNIESLKNLLPHRTMKVDGQDIGKLLTDEQVAHQMKRLNPPSFIQRIKEFFFGPKNTQEYKIIEFAERFREAGGNNWGLYRDGIITLARHAGGGVGEKVVRHEMFHKIFWEYLSFEDQMHVLNLAEQRYGKLTQEELEERLAEEFAEYSKKPTFLGLITEFFKRVLDLIGFSYYYLNSIESFFEAIERGAYAGEAKYNRKVTRAMQYIATAFESVERYDIARNAFIHTFRDIYSNRDRREELVSFDDAVAETISALRAFVDDPNSPGTELQLVSRRDMDEVRKAIRVFFENDQKALKGFLKDYFAHTTLADEYTKNLLKNKFIVSPELRNTLSQVTTGEVIDSIDGMDVGTAIDLLEDVIQDSRDNLESIESEEAKEDLAASIGYLDREITGLKDEIFDHELRDPVLKITGRIKQKLVALRYDTIDGQTKFTDLNGAYSVFAHAIKLSDTTSLRAFATDVHRKMSALSPSKTGEARTVREAVGRSISQVTANVLDVLDNISNQSIRDDISFRKDVSQKHMYAVISLDGSPVLNVPTSTVLRKGNETKYRMYTLEEGEPVQVLAQRIIEGTKDSGNPITQQEITDTFIFQEDLNFLRSAAAAVASLREAKPHKGHYYLKYGEFKFSYFPINKGVSKQIYESHVQHAISSFIKSRQDFDNLFDEEVRTPFIPVDLKIKDKRDRIREFLRVLGLGAWTPKLDIVSDNAINGIYESVQFALPSMNGKFVEYKKTENYDIEEAYEYIMADNYSFLSKLVAGLNVSSSVAEVGSYMRGDGNKAYGLQDASFQSYILEYLTGGTTVAPENFRAVQTGSGYQVVSNGKDKLIEKSIYAQTTNEKGKKVSIGTIYGYVDHDSIVRRGYSNATFLTREKRKDTIMRNFTAGFMVYQARNNGRFVQFLPNPANRKSVQGAVVNILDRAKSKDTIKHILKGQATRPREDEYNDKVYARNRNKALFPGLAKVLITEKNYESLAKDAFDNLVKQGEELYMEMFEGENPMQVNHYQILSMAKALGIQVQAFDPNKFKETRRALKNNRDQNGKIIEAEDAKQRLEKLHEDYRKEMNKILKEIVIDFNLNYAIHQHSLTELIYMDKAFAKHKEDLTKRTQVFSATGDALLSDPVYGMPPKTRVMVMKDVDKNVLFNSFSPNGAYRKTYTPTDGEGFITPEYYEAIAKSYGIEYGADTVLKPVAAGKLENGQPFAIKYSVKVLTDELVNSFPELKKLRDEMYANKADQAVFESAVKIGIPKSTIKTDFNFSDFVTKTKKEDAIMELPTRFFRFQLNPASNIDSSAANSSQGTAMMNTNGENTAEVRELHQLNSRLIDAGLRILSRKLRISDKGTLTMKTEQELRKILTSMAENVPGKLDLYNLLSSKTGGFGYTVDVSSPLVESASIPTISSMFSKLSVGIRFKGSKMVLQSAIGTAQLIDSQTGNLVNASDLLYKDENGYTEVYLPVSYKEHLKVGDKFTIGNQDGVVAFRIPVSNYHSLLSLTVKGFYKTPVGSKSNVIIAPSEIVHYQGSDYDVDTLFIIRKEKLQEDSNVAELFKKYDRTGKFKGDVKFVAGSTPGFDENGRLLTWKGNPIDHYLENMLEVINSRVIDLTEKFADKNKTLTVAEKDQLSLEIEALEKDLASVYKVLAISLKNRIVDLFSKNLREEKNRTDLQTPITTDRVAQTKHSILEELKSLLQPDKDSISRAESKRFLEDLKAAGLIKYDC